MDKFGTSQKVVIVEDNESLAEIYKARLELLGYTCFAAYDGVQALEVIEKELPDLVLLDMMVPKVAGDQILARMRASEWGKNIKVMVISNLNEVDAPKGLRDLGIEGYAVKANLSNDQLDQLVEAILKPAGQTEDAELATPDTVVKETTPIEVKSEPIAVSPDSGISSMPAVAEPITAASVDQPAPQFAIPPASEPPQTDVPATEPVANETPPPTTVELPTPVEPPIAAVTANMPVTEPAASEPATGTPPVAADNSATTTPPPSQPAPPAGTGEDPADIAL